MAYSEDHIALAAEYALGTLDAAGRAQVETMVTVDKDYAAIVQAWEFRLSVLNQMVGLVEPRPQVWDRIKATIAAAQVQAPAVPEAVPEFFEMKSLEVESPEVRSLEMNSPETVAPESQSSAVESLAAAPADADSPESEAVTPALVEPEAVPATPLQSEFAQAEAAPESPPPVVTLSPAVVEPGPGRPVNDNINVIQLASKVRQWRTVANAMTALAAVLLATLSVQVYRPDLLPEVLRPKPRTQLVEVKVPPPPLSAQYVALLQKDAASPAFILTVDAASKNFTVRRVGAAPEPGKSFELWLVSDKLQRPRSLGVIGGSDFITRPALSSYDADTVSRATYAVTVEPEGGSPTGVATGPIVFTGKLIEAVPQATAAPAPARK